MTAATITRGSRGRATTVTMRRTTAIAPLIEGQAFAQEVMNAADRIYTAATVGSRQGVINETARLQRKAIETRDELHRMAGEWDR
jgi:hypothetical protein